MSEKEVNLNIQKTDPIYCLDIVHNPAFVSYEKIVYKVDLTRNIGYEPLQRSGALISFKLPTKHRPHDIKNLVFNNSEKAKVSWGSSWNRFGHNINDIIPKDEDFIKYASNNVWCNINDVTQVEKEFVLMDLVENYGLSKIKARQKVFFNWFFHNGYYYIQIGYRRIAEIYGSLSKGAFWLNLGSGLTLELYDE